MIWTRRAAIDIGTNSIKLLVAEVQGREVRPLHEESKQTRLGKGFYEAHRLQPDAVARTALAVAELAACARAHGAVGIRAFATSAARDAVNAAELIKAVHAASGLRPEVLSGEREADWVFLGVTSDPRFAREPLLILDIGGGSTEFILGRGEQKHFQQSFPLGTVRLMEAFPHGDPPSPADLARCREYLKVFLRNEIAPKLQPAIANETAASGSGGLRLLATGGTTTILARMEAGLDTYDREAIESVRFTSGAAKAQTERLWNLPLAQRKTIKGLPPSRADVILPGAAIVEAVMQQLGFEEMRVSTRGIRFAALMDGQWP